MEQTSLEQFNSLIDTLYGNVKKYIVSSNDKKVILEDYENYAWEKNPDLQPLFDNPSPLPIRNIEVSYSERYSMFSITIHLK